MKLFRTAIFAFTLGSTLPLWAEVPTEKRPIEKPAAGEEQDGSSFEKAVVAKSIEAEYQWLAKHYPGYKMGRQSLVTHAKKPYDVLAITTKEGKALDVYFDISSFFGK